MNGRNGWIWQLRKSFKPVKEDLLKIIEELTNNMEKDRLLKKNAMKNLHKLFNEEQNLKTYLEILKK